MNVFYFLSGQHGWKDQARVCLCPPLQPLYPPRRSETLTVGMGLLWTRRDWLARLLERIYLLRCVSVRGGVCCQTLYNLTSPPPPLRELASPILWFWRLFFWMPIAAGRQGERVKNNNWSIHLRWVIDGSTVIIPKQAGNTMHWRIMHLNISNYAIRRVNSKHR